MLPAGFFVSSAQVDVIDRGSLGFARGRAGLGRVSNLIQLITRCDQLDYISQNEFSAIRDVEHNYQWDTNV